MMGAANSDGGLARALWCAVVACISVLQFGYHITEFLPSSYSEDAVEGVSLKNRYELTSKERQNGFGVYAVGCVFGPLWDLFVPHFGTPRTLQAVAVIPSLIGAIVQTFASTRWMFFLGRFIVGVGAGAGLAVVPPYIGAVSPAKYRGPIGVLVGVFISLGIVMSSALDFIPGVGDTLPRFIPLFSAIIAIVQTVLLFFVDNVQHTKDDTGSNDSEKTSTVAPSLPWWRMMDKSDWTRFFALLASHAAMQLCGINAYFAVAPHVLKVNFPENFPLVLLLLSCYSLFMATMPAFILGRFGKRRPLIFFSAIGISLFSLLLFVGEYMSISILSTVALFGGITAFNLGLSTVPFVIIAEIPRDPRLISIHARASLFVNSVSIAIIIFVVCNIIETYNAPLEDGVPRKEGNFAFLIMVALPLMLVAYMYRALPETGVTAGKSDTTEKLLNESEAKVEQHKEIV